MRTNILTAYYKEGELNVIGSLYQYDYGQRIVFADLDLPTAYEVHFSNEERGESYIMIGDSTGVDIPDELLQTGKNIYVWIYLHTGESDGETVYRYIVNVRRRAEPIHETPTPVQQNEIEQAIIALNSAVETTAQDVIDANAAKGAAEYAQGKAEDAQGAAEAAQGAAEIAQRAAETAQGKAEDAQTAAETAQGAAELAEDGAEESAQDAEAWAVGKRNGTDVSSSDPTYHNNSKYYSDRAEADIGKIENMTVDAEEVAPSGTVDAIISEVDGHKHIHFKITKGNKGDKGNPGKDFHIAKTFSSIAQMEAYTGTDLEPYDFVMIDTGSVEDPDTGKLYCYSSGDNLLNPNTMTANVSGNKQYIFTADTVWDGVHDYYLIHKYVPNSVETIDQVTVYPTPSAGQKVLINKTFTTQTNCTQVKIEFNSAITVYYPALYEKKWSYIGDLSGAQGIKGDDGFSPVVAVSTITGGHKVAITDATGTDEFNVMDGVTPVASVSKSGHTATITITDANGTTTEEVDDGDTGATPVISIGTVTTLTPGSDATASMDTTDPEHPVLSLGIPEGEPGDATIDDTKGIGDTDYVWSADKDAKELDKKAPVIEQVIDTHASVVSFTDGAGNLPMEITVGIEPVQSGTGDPSPENIRPITGHTGTEIGVYYKNIYNSEGTTRSRAGSAYHLELVSKTEIRLYNTTNKDYYASKQQLNLYNLVVGKTYRVSAKLKAASGNYYARVAIRDSNDAIKDSAAFTYIGQTAEFTFTYNPTTHNYISFFCTHATSTQANITYSEISLSEIVQKTITFPSEAGTVYGGTLKVNKDKTGVLTVTDANIASYDGETLPSTWISDRDVYAEGTTPTTGAQVVYKLAEPVVYNLTVGQIKSLYGINNVLADTGDILSVDYSADTKTYIDSTNETQDTAIKAMIADSDSVVATESHEQGNVFICGNSLYRATDAIAIGETLTVGTNVEVLNLADYIAEVVASIGNTISGVQTDVGTLQTDVGALQETAINPDAILTKQTYIQNASGTFSSRAWDIKNGVIHVKYTSGGTGARGMWITNTQSMNSGSASTAVPPTNTLEPIKKLDGVTLLRMQTIATTDNLNSNIIINIYFCKLEDDTVTVLQRIAISTYYKNNLYSISIPEGTTHYAMMLYSSSVNAGAYEYTIYPQFIVGTERNS